MSIVYRARFGYVEGKREVREPPLHPPPLGHECILDHLQWIPGRFRLQFAQIIHFALAILVTRLRLGEVPSAIEVVHLKFWLVKDLRAFCGKLLSDYLETWLDEVELRVADGEFGLFQTFDLKDFKFVSSTEVHLKYEEFSPKSKGLFFHVWRSYVFSDYEYDISIPDPEAVKF